MSIKVSSECPDLNFDFKSVIYILFVPEKPAKLIRSSMNVRVPIRLREKLEWRMGLLFFVPPIECYLK